MKSSGKYKENLKTMATVKRTRLPLNNELLVEIVREFLFLYDTGDSRYKDVVMKENRWAVIAAQLKSDAISVKKRWKSLRDWCRKEKLFYDNQKWSGQGWIYMQQSKWTLYPNLSGFLQKTMEFRDTSSNLKEFEDDDPENQCRDENSIVELESNNSSIITCTDDTSIREEDKKTKDENTAIRDEDQKIRNETNLKKIKLDVDQQILNTLNVVSQNLISGNSDKNENDEAYLYAMSLIPMLRRLESKDLCMLLRYRST